MTTNEITIGAITAFAPARVPNKVTRITDVNIVAKIAFRSVLIPIFVH